MSTSTYIISMRSISVLKILNNLNDSKLFFITTVQRGIWEEEGKIVYCDLSDEQLRDYERCTISALEELKIESKTFRSNPELLVEKIASYTEDNKKTMNLVSIKDIIKENYEKAKEQGLEKEFLSITPDSEIRIGSS